MPAPTIAIRGVYGQVGECWEASWSKLKAICDNSPAINVVSPDFIGKVNRDGGAAQKVGTYRFHTGRQ
jgi:hypothetical protein